MPGYYESSPLEGSKRGGAWHRTPRPAAFTGPRAVSDDREAAIFAALPAGAYTAVVHGIDETTGVGLVEAYNIP